MFYGGDYNPEQWTEDVWIQDVHLMREARVNLVSLGVFSWSRIQPSEGRWDFGWLDRVLELLHDGGVGVNLATATATLPHWAVARYPDILPVTEDGVVLFPGSRQHYAPTSPDYRRLAADLVGAIAERYAAHPAVRMWHVNNEYACHIRAEYSVHATTAFREWLRDRYGSVDALNHAWGTDFWSQRFGSFDEVLAPRRAPTSRNPAGMLDFHRFTSDSILDLYRTEKAIIRAAGGTQPVTTNFMGLFPALDYWKWAEEVDVVADDSYPDPHDPESFRDAALTRDLMRSLKPREPWILMEQAPNAVNWRPSNAQKAPGQMAAWSEQAVARGAGGIMFFQWRQAVSGSEKFHSAMVPHAGTDTRTWREVVALGARLEGTATDDVPAADIGIVLDWDTWWAIEQPDHPARIDYSAEVHRWYRALHRGHFQVDFVKPGQALDGRRLVIAPSLYLLRDEDAAALAAFVEGGGTLVTTAFTDIVDENDRFLPGGFATRLGPTFGCAIVDFGGLTDAGIPASLGDSSFTALTMLEELAITTGEVIATAEAGAPVVVRNARGAGTSFHAASLLDEDGVAALLRAAVYAAEVEPVVAGAPAEVEAIETAAGVTLINQSPVTQSVTLPAGGTVELAAFECQRLARIAP